VISFLLSFQSQITRRRHLHSANVAQEVDAAEAEDPDRSFDRTDGQGGSRQAGNLACKIARHHPVKKTLQKDNLKNDVKTFV
jgi:hypothetical protein